MQTFKELSIKLCFSFIVKSNCFTLFLCDNQDTRRRKDYSESHILTAKYAPRVRKNDTFFYTVIDFVISLQFTNDCIACFHIRYLTDLKSGLLDDFINI